MFELTKEFTFVYTMRMKTNEVYCINTIKAESEVTVVGKWISLFVAKFCCENSQFSNNYHIYETVSNRKSDVTPPNLIPINRKTNTHHITATSFHINTKQRYRKPNNNFPKTKQILLGFRKNKSIIIYARCQLKLYSDTHIHNI